MSPLPEFFHSSYPEYALQETKWFFVANCRKPAGVLLSEEYLLKKMDWRDRRFIRERFKKGDWPYYIGGVSIPRLGDLSWYDFLVSEARGLPCGWGIPAEIPLIGISEVRLSTCSEGEQPLIKSATLRFSEGLGGTEGRTPRNFDLFFPEGGQPEDLASIGIVQSAPFLHLYGKVCQHVIVFGPRTRNLLLSQDPTDSARIVIKPIKIGNFREYHDHADFFGLKFVPLKKKTASN